MPNLPSSLAGRALAALALFVSVASPAAETRPRLFLIGDSTVNNGTRGFQGWGARLGELFDPARIEVVNRARGGRSSRTFLTEGLWSNVVRDLRPGDFVLLQFGHNDGGGLRDPRNRASLKGNGDETEEVPHPETGASQTVHSYGWYLRRYIADAKERGATPLVLSPVPRNLWKDGKVARAGADYGKWAREAATQGGAAFVDLNELVARRYEALGPERVQADFFLPTDHTHTTPAGARLNAECVVEGLRAVPDAQLAKFLLPVAAMATGAAASPDAPATAYLFSHFIGNGEDGLHLAWSRDGLNWEALNGGRSYLRPEVGESKLMRDPCLLRGPDGTFHMVWTTSWTGRTIGYASSKDLLAWSEQKAIPVMAHEPEALNCWAPEVVWDARRARFLIFWATTIPGRFPATDGQGDQKYNHRMYCTTTADFRDFAPTRLFYDPDFNVIDATILEAEGRFHLLFKDETLTPPRKHLRRASADDVEGPWGNLTPPFTRDWVEGPSALKVGEHYLVYFDAYRDHRYEALRSRDLKTWEDVTPRLSFPKGMRHGTALAVPGEVVKRLLN